MSARPANRRLDALLLGSFRTDCIVEGERTVNEATGDLTTLGHLGKGSCIQRCLQLGIDHLDRREHGHARLLYAKHVREVDGVLHDVALVGQRRDDVDRGVGDEDRSRITRHVHDVDVADSAAGPKAGIGRHDRMHELVCVAESPS